MLNGKTAIVTGGAGGIGLETCRQLAAAGASVLLTDLDADLVASAVAEIGGEVRGRVLDVTSEEDWQGAVAEAQAAFGPLDILVNNAGILLIRSIAQTTLADFRRVMSINVEGVFLGIQAAFPAMAERGGCIVNISSLAGLIGVPNQLAYNTSKGAVRLMTKSAAMEAVSLGYPIRVNSIHPGIVETRMAEDGYRIDSNPARGDRIRQSVPLGRFVQPQEVAGAVMFLLSDAAASMTGSELVLDGGANAGQARMPRPAPLSSVA